MPAPDLEQSLRDLPRIGTLIKDRGYRQIWRFEHAGRAYFLKFYPKVGPRDRVRRFFRGSPAMAEFSRLQLLQKASIPAPRAVAALMGFRINESVGDAVILEAIEPSVTLDRYLSEHQLAGRDVPNRLALVKNVLALVQKLGAAGLGHEDLHLGNFLLQNDKLFLLDGYAVRTAGLSRDDVLLLGHSATPWATRADLVRGWWALRPGLPLPKRNRVSPRIWSGLIERVTRENRYFGKLSDEGWNGLFLKRSLARPWSGVSRLQFTHDEWLSAWRSLNRQIASDSMQLLKRSLSGDVLAGELVVGSNPLQIIVKRPRRRYWYRYLNEIGRGSRPRRAWMKAWRAIHRDLPTAWPLLLMEKRVAGYVVDALIVFARIPGEVLSTANLDALSVSDRDRLFRRAGRTLRKIESFEWSHFDAKSSNWIVLTDVPGGPYPVMIDIDGIRRRRWRALGIKRLLKSLLNHPQYTPDDSLALCQGYAPRGGMVRPPVVHTEPTNPQIDSQ